MRKILVAIDAMKTDARAVDFACYLAGVSGSKVTGVFLENIFSEEIYEAAAENSICAPQILSHDKRNKITEQNIQDFIQTCEAKGVNANVHRKRGIPVDAMVEESRFADMIIVNADISFKHIVEATPTEFVIDLLEEAECPVIVAPESFEDMKEIVFAYDGGRSSLSAIKKFTYLFPEFKEKNIVILEVNKEKENNVRAKHQLMEWLKIYYDNVDFKLLNGDSAEELFKYLINKQNLFMVMGAYGRGMLSSFFKPSRARLLLKSTIFPIFITHT